MSRSRKKHPFGGFMDSASEKDEKVMWHRRYRRVCKVLIRKGMEDMPNFRVYSNLWGMRKDGKFMFDPRTEAKRLRK